MAVNVDVLSLSTEPLKLVHDSQFVIMTLQPGVEDLSIDGGPTQRLEYVAGDIALCRRHVVGQVQSRNQMKKLRFEVSDLRLSEAAGDANREIELQNITRLEDMRIRALMTAVNVERTHGFPSGQIFLQSVEVALAAVLVHTYSLSVKARNPIRGGLSDNSRRNVIDLVRSRISEDISLADMAAVTGLSITHFSRIFKRSMGESPHQFVLQQRVQYAKGLLLKLNLRVIDVALASGFKTQQHFARIFREMCGLSPTEYQRLKLSKRLRGSHVGSSANSATEREWTG
jgi:AraC family transcriptional regulator